MFDRYTEKARRVIFFARLEASNYGSTAIGTEHILIGLLREDHALVRQFVGSVDLAAQIRAEVDKVVKRGERVSTSMEMPLNAEASKVLKLASEEAERLAHRHIGTEHILLGILGLKDSFAASLLTTRGANAATIRERIAQGSASRSVSTERVRYGQPVPSALVALDSFLGSLKANGSQQPADCFHDKGQFVDSSGKRWIGREEIEKGAEVLFARFAKKNASFLVEDTTEDLSGTVVASVVWEIAAVSGDRSKSMLRMSIVFGFTGADWVIVLAQVTPVLLV
jgi:ATP-dependent Clp protease ATP-binding subunit ClpA